MGAWDWVKDHIDPGNLLHQNDVANQPGVNANGASHGNQQFLVKQPNGTFLDTSTGLTYADQYGQSQIANPNLAQQSAINQNRSSQILAGLGGARADAATAFNGQQVLIKNLDGTISGATPSVAQNQLTQGLGQIQRTQMAGAAGASGNNAFAARRAALANIGNASSATDQAQAILRAKEINDAQMAKGGVLAAMASGANTQAGQDIQGAGGFADTSLSAQKSQQGADAAANAINTAESNDKAQRTAGALGSLWSFGGSKGSSKSEGSGYSSSSQVPGEDTEDPK